MGRENIFHFFTSQVLGESGSCHAFGTFCWYKELLKLIFIYIRVIPKVQGRTFACISRLFLVLALLDCVVCYRASAPVELQYWLVLNWVNCQKMLLTFMLSLSKCCELLVLCRMKSTILSHWWWNYLKKCEDWAWLQWRSNVWRDSRCT